MQRIKKITRRLLEFLFINPLFSNPLIVGGSSALFIVYSHYYLLPPIIRDIPSTDMEHIKNFIEWFGVPYGLFIALVLVNLWNQHDTVDREFDAEADAVSALQHTALMVKKNPSSSRPRKIILSKIDEYVNHV